MKEVLLIMDEEQMLDDLMKKGKIAQEKIYTLLKEVASKDFFDITYWQISTGGKRVRPALTLIFAEMGGKPLSDGVIYAAAGVELIHNYSLVIDDIIDRGEIRRNEPTTRAKYGDEMALLAGMLHREAIWLCGTRAKPHEREIANIYSITISDLVEGERLDVLFEQEERPHEYFKDNVYPIVTEDDYFKMVRGKTAALVMASCKIGAIMAESGPYLINAAEKFGEYIGLAFQIADDILDLSGDEEKFGKTIGKDIRESKLGNYPIIKALENMDEETEHEFLKILKSRPSSKEDINKCLKMIEDHKGFALARKKAMNFVNMGRDELAKFPESKQRKMLWDLSEFMVVRTI